MIRIPNAALVLLIGASGSGKSTFAARHFDSDAVVSSDRLRAVVAGDEGDQQATDAAFDWLRAWVDARLAAGSLAVVDATNVEWMRRTELISRARRPGRPSIALALEPPADRGPWALPPFGASMTNCAEVSTAWTWRALAPSTYCAPTRRSSASPSK